MLLTLATATIVNTSLNFRDYSIKHAVDKAEMTASIVKDGLTSHMVNGIMDKRQYFLDQISSNEKIRSLWLVRSDHVIKQYGDGFNNETVRDAIDSEVLKSGEIVKDVIESSEAITLRITIPYKATADSSTNCLSCHDVNREDTLGAISMEFDITNMRNSGMVTIIKILAINLIFTIIVLFLINYYVTPYMKLFSNLQDGIKKAYSGDFTHKFYTSVSGDGKSITVQMNTLFKKMQEAFGDIKYNLSTFIPQGCTTASDPLYEAKTIIKELSDIYKFKKTIELDETRVIIYTRITDILKIKYQIKCFSLYEINNISKERRLIYISDDGVTICDNSVNKEVLQCRAHRTKTDVISNEFVNLCQTCTANNLQYICIPFQINNDNSLVLSITDEREEEIGRINGLIPSIRNYLEAAKPVIESRILMDKLRDTSLKDGMTGLYNRRFLEEFIDQVMHQAIREQETYSVLMLDVDWFKMVNDTYGHDIGDKVIVEIGKLLKSSIRESDLAIRYGGEEFVVMLHNATEEGTIKIASLIHEKFASLVFDVGNGETIQKTMSIGIANFPNDGDTIWKCIKYADTALYVAKTTGRNKIVNYTCEMSESDDVR
ncbi:MAG: GGDEF domain-containing protein [Campylobacterota bacterium]|nr:GGDEF domain-containing protein [Campylobacterota bacterium]